MKQTPVILAIVAVLLFTAGSLGNALTRSHPASAPQAFADVLTTTMGPLYPTSASGISNAQNVTASDNQIASTFMSGTLSTTGYPTNGLPSNAHVTQLIVEVQARSGDTGREALDGVIIKSGQTVLNNDTTSTLLPSSNTWTTRTYMIAPDPTLLTSPALTIAFHFSYVGPTNNNSTVYIDAVRLTIVSEPQPLPTATVAPTDTPASLPTDTPAPTETLILATVTPTIIAQWDTNGTVVLLEALQRQLDVIRVYEVDAGSAYPQLIGSPPDTELEDMLQLAAQLTIEICARDPGIAARMLNEHPGLIRAWLEAYPDLTGSLSGRAHLWLADQGLAVP